MSGQAGFGTLPFGTGGFGSSTGDEEFVSESVSIVETLEVIAPFKVVTAVSLSPTLLKVDFTGFVDPNHASNFDVANYTIAGLTITNVDPYGVSKSIILQTSLQLAATYTVVLNATPGVIQGLDGDQLDPLYNTAQFLGAVSPATASAVAQSRRKIRLHFSEPMLFDAEFTDPANFLLSGFDGTGIDVDRIEQVGPDTTRAQLILGTDLTPFMHYSLQIDALVRTVTGKSIWPEDVPLHWIEAIPRPISVSLSAFSGEVTTGLLGAPEGQVFFSPAFGLSVPASVIQVDNVSVCTRAYDVYTIPSLPDPLILFTFPSPWGGSPRLGAGGGVLRASAARLGLAEMALSDLRQDAVPPPMDGPVEGLLQEPIDITRASFLNDARWRIFPGTGAALGAFHTADNLTPIGPGPTVGPFPIP